MKKAFQILFFLMLIFRLFSTIIEIPADQPTIQQGIDVSTNGDSVLVQPGNYFENINYNGKNITVASLFLTTQDTTFISETIIDGNQNGSVVTFENGENTTAVLSGFTITNGNAEFGGGILCYESTPTVLYTSIIGNIAQYGGGVFFVGWADSILENVMIIDNYAISGGGIYCGGSSSPSIVSSIINNNYAIEGGAVCLYVADNITFLNATIYNNTADCGGGFFIGYTSSAELVNCILWNNSSEEIYFGDNIYPSSISINHSDIQEGEDGIISETYNYIYWQEGNIDSDPLFLAPENGDFHLTENSPCIDAGDPNSPLDPDGTIADMGAFYFDQSISIADSPEIEIGEFVTSNFPNPFITSTTISFNLAAEHTEKTEILIYNIKGRKVRTLDCNNLVNAKATRSLYSKIWNGTDDSGNPVNSGIYFYKLESGKYNAVNKMMLIR